MRFSTRLGVLTACQCDIGSSVPMALISGTVLVLIVIVLARNFALLMPYAGLLNVGLAALLSDSARKFAFFG